MLEQYNKTVNIEGQLMVQIANRYILPAALGYLGRVAQSVASVKAAGGKSIFGSIAGRSRAKAETSLSQ